MHLTSRLARVGGRSAAATAARPAAQARLRAPARGAFMAQPARSMGFFSDMMSKLKQDPELKKALDELEKSDAAEAARTAMEKAKEGVAAASDGLDTAQDCVI